MRRDDGVLYGDHPPVVFARFRDSTHPLENTALGPENTLILAFTLAYINPQELPEEFDARASVYFERDELS